MLKSLKTNLPYWLLMFSLLCLSGNPLFSYESKTTAQAFGIILLIAIIKKGDRVFHNMQYLLPYLIIFILQATIIPSFSMTSTGYVVMKLVIGVCYACIIGERFVGDYIKVMWILAILSLIGFTLTLTIGILPGIPCSKECVSQVVYTQIFSQEILERNCGMFWEPGAFAGYLCLALLSCIYTNQVKMRTITPLLIALLTTYSTTGYLVLFVLVLYYLNTSNVNNKIIRYILIAISIVGILYSYYNLEFLGAKINSDDEMANSRISNYTTFSEVISQNIIIGASFTDAIGGTGNGFLSFLLDYGIIGFLYYFIILFRKSRSLLTIKESRIYIIILAIILQGECFLNYPLFMALPCVLYAYKPQMSQA